MALVRISNALIESVQSRIRNMMRQSLTGLQLPTVSTEIQHKDAEYPDVVDAIRAAAWGEYQHLETQMNPAWCTKPTLIDLHYRGLSFRVRTEDTVVLPPGYSSYRPDVYIKEPSTVPMLDAKLVEYNRVLTEREAVTNQFAAIEAQIVAFLRAHPSLNAALKAQPEISMYVDDYYITKVNEVRTTVKATKEEPEMPTIDVGAMVAAAIAHRMAIGGAA